MAAEPTNIVVCPRCGAENFEGADTCENCIADLRTIDVPDTAQMASESDLTRPIGSIRLSKARTVSPDATVREAISAMKEDVTGAVVVTLDGRIVGIFTERDVLKKIAGEPQRLDDAVAAHMTSDPVVLRENDAIAVALNKMGVGGFRLSLSSVMASSSPWLLPAMPVHGCLAAVSTDSDGYQDLVYGCTVS